MTKAPKSSPDKIAKNSATRNKNLVNTGRPKGALNKTTQSAKDAIAQAAESLGGTARLVEWVKEDPSNEKVFWGTIYPKLLPLTLSGSVSINVIDELLSQVDGSQLLINDNS